MTEPNAIKSLAGVARPRAAEYPPSPRKDASATARRGAFLISVKILHERTVRNGWTRELDGGTTGPAEHPTESRQIARMLLLCVCV